MSRSHRQINLDWLVARPAAHRGLHDIAVGVVENTRHAFARAMASGYAIECDLQLSGDGEAMVFHDFTLDRLMRAEGRLDARSSDELRAVSYKTGTDHMQTLNELLEQVAGAATLIVELKSRFDGDPRLPCRVADTLHGYRGPIAVMSFDPGMIETFRQRAPGRVRGVVLGSFHKEYWPDLSEARRQELRDLADEDQVKPDFLSCGIVTLPSGPSRRYRRAGKPVLCWTVRGPEQAARALEHSDQITFEGYLP